jgi:hypothetical protein
MVKKSHLGSTLIGSELYSAKGVRSIEVIIAGLVCIFSRVKIKVPSG